MVSSSPILWWVRRDLRLSDNPALAAAVSRARPLIPVFLHDETVESLGAAPRWRLGLGVERLAKRLRQLGAGLVCRRGPARETLLELVAETGAGTVVWNRCYDPDSIARDMPLKAELARRGVAARSFGGHVVFEPWALETGAGRHYKVYTPYWKALRVLDAEPPLASPANLTAPDIWPRSEDIADWHMGAGMGRGADVVAAHVRVGEEAAADRLEQFLEERLPRYTGDRDRPDLPATSGLSENLAWGEIGPRRCWQAGMMAMDAGVAGAETFLRELAWREFAYHLMYHTPRLLTANWRTRWDAFPWNAEANAPEVLAWKQGRTGVAFVDAAMRQMHVSGTMHNRARMIAASYLTKHLLTHWRIGQAWFAQHLIDWDPASNAMGWQWTAGSGPDAAPYFRIFNPDTQLARFDPHGVYTDRWLAEGRARPTDTALSYYRAIPRRWNLSPGDPPPQPVIGLSAGRARALAAYETVRV
ncbi:deoxyribodipyrimidine photo-lyase [Rhodovulum imhoffii]|uniref:Deoxyribodipyrimidine photo-lyase n=1 Tax=Rhodovulum imhoffii TaxID=365340 RepID=A0A2T5BVI0_9RHOB|nr:deoxyribodipyrimidine photo-lyase [Rhodovulum imhoffii]MBK5932847.1 deoxyribodipyrimidine photolyase [Rhodovulum imhoffii]PTN03583.1 deoxyribodipyrimidine photo-lyase [Rhodovulum imhoffii]